MLGLLPDNTYPNIFQISACLYFLKANKEIDDNLIFLKTANGILCSQISSLLDPLEKNHFIKKPANSFSRENLWELDIKGAKSYTAIKDFDRSLLTYLPDIVNMNSANIERTIMSFLYIKTGLSSSEYSKIPRGTEIPCPTEFSFPRQTSFTSKNNDDDFAF